MPIDGRDVLIIEDVVDTGLTLNYLIRTLQLREPRDARRMHAARSAVPPARRRSPIRYVGFTVPDEFFVGYGFDLDQRYRGLPDLRVVNFPQEAA